MQKVEEQVIPVKDIRFQCEVQRKEQAEAIAELELKLNKSFLMVTHEIDQMKEPLTDTL